MDNRKGNIDFITFGIGYGQKIYSISLYINENTQKEIFSAIPFTIVQDVEILYHLFLGDYSGRKYLTMSEYHYVDLDRHRRPTYAGVATIFTDKPSINIKTEIEQAIEENLKIAIDRRENDEKTQNLNIELSPCKKFEFPSIAKDKETLKRYLPKETKHLIFPKTDPVTYRELRSVILDFILKTDIIADPLDIWISPNIISSKKVWERLRDFFTGYTLRFFDKSEEKEDILLRVLEHRVEPLDNMFAEVKAIQGRKKIDAIQDRKKTDEFRRKTEIKALLIIDKTKDRFSLNLKADSKIEGLHGIDEIDSEKSLISICIDSPKIDDILNTQESNRELSVAGSDDSKKDTPSKKEKTGTYIDPSENNDKTKFKYVDRNTFSFKIAKVIFLLLITLMSFVLGVVVTKNSMKSTSKDEGTIIKNNYDFELLNLNYDRKKRQIKLQLTCTHSNINNIGNIEVNRYQGFYILKNTSIKEAIVKNEIIAFPKGIDTLISINGVNLSEYILKKHVDGHKTLMIDLISTAVSKSPQELIYNILRIIKSDGDQLNKDELNILVNPGFFSDLSKSEQRIVGFLHENFQEYDKNEDGRISAEEIKNVDF